MRRGSRSPLLTAPRASLGRDMLRRLASNLGGVAARSGRGAFGAVPAVHAQQRSAGGLMVVRLPLLGCPSRAVGERGSEGAAPRTPRRGRSRRGVIAATRRPARAPGGTRRAPRAIASRANPHPISSSSPRARPVRATRHWDGSSVKENAREEKTFFSVKEKPSPPARRADVTLKRTHLDTHDSTATLRTTTTVCSGLSPRRTCRKCVRFCSGTRPTTSDPR
jgi:hypothetical protein